MASKPSFTEILKTAKNIQNQVSAAQKDMHNKQYPIEHSLFEANLGGDDFIHSLVFKDAAKNVTLTELADALVEAINAVKAEIKQENKSRMAEITKNMFPGDFGDGQQ
jgi:DNA-binding protein YbaB